MATITRSDFANRLRERFGLTTADALKLVDIVFDEIRESLIHGEEVKFAGFGAEILSTIMESRAFYKLKSPVRRLGAAFCPVPSAKKLEENVFPTPFSITDAAAELIKGV